MADSDPFSGIPLSDALSDSDNSSLSRVLSLALAETDDIYQPAARAVANFIASKISGLSQVKIARLSDNEIARLIESELSRLPEGELRRLIDADISSFVDGLKTSLIRFSATILLRLLNGLHQICSSKYFEVVFVTGASLLILRCYYKSYQRMIKNSPSYKYEVSYEVFVASNVASNVAQQEQPKTSIWSDFLSNIPDLKGFKAIEETNTDVRRVISASNSIISDAKI